MHDLSIRNIGALLIDEANLHIHGHLDFYLFSIRIDNFDIKQTNKVTGIFLNAQSLFCPGYVFLVCQLCVSIIICVSIVGGCLRHNFGHTKGGIFWDALFYTGCDSHFIVGSLAGQLHCSFLCGRCPIFRHYVRCHLFCCRSGFLVGNLFWCSLL